MTKPKTKNMYRLQWRRGWEKRWRGSELLHTNKRVTENHRANCRSLDRSKGEKYDYRIIKLEVPVT